MLCNRDQKNLIDAAKRSGLPGTLQRRRSRAFRDESGLAAWTNHGKAVVGRLALAEGGAAFFGGGKEIHLRAAAVENTWATSLVLEGFVRLGTHGQYAIERWTFTFGSAPESGS